MGFFLVENIFRIQIKVFHRSQGYLICIYSKQRSYYYFIWLGEQELQLMKEFNCNPLQYNPKQKFYNSVMAPFQDKTTLSIQKR